ncbi:MAG: ABC transporter ATP-binding protein [Nannocystaceae bacterium]
MSRDGDVLAAIGLGRAIAGRWLYRGLDHRFAPATFTAIVGPNGAGKSTLLRDLAGLRTPAAGAIELGGRPLRSLPPGERARLLAYLPQATSLAHDLRADEVVMLGRTPFLGRFAGPRPADHAAVRRALATVGADALAERPVSTLSGGERQRVMLARMLATEAPLLLLDEPTAALDVGHALSFLGLCRELVGGGATIVAVLHDLGLARRHADEALLLGDPDGAVAHGPVASVLTPAALAPIFQVAVRSLDGHLVFETAARADDRSPGSIARPR